MRGYDLYVDGSCDKGKMGIGGVAYTPEGDLFAEWSRPVSFHAANNLTAESFAVLEGLGRLPAGVEVNLYTDSEWTINGVHGYHDSGAQALQSKAFPTYSPIFQEILAAKAKFGRVTLYHVNGHSGMPGNERADELAGFAAIGLTSEPSRSLPVANQAVATTAPTF